MPFYGWTVAAVATLVTFASGPGQSYVFSVFLDPIIADTGMSRTFVSTLYAVGTGFSAAMIMVVSRLVDRFGARIMLVIIAALTGVACIGMSAVQGPVGLLLGFAALRALGQGSLPITAVIVVAQWFVRYRGRAMSLLAIGFAASNAIFPPFSRFMIEEIGWRGAYVGLAVAVWLLIIPASILFIRNRPEDIGLHPDGAYEPVDADSIQDDDGVDRRRILTSMRFWLLAIPLSVIPFIVTALVFHQVSILGERGLSPAIAATIFVPYALATAATSAVSGVLTDRFGPRWMLVGNLTFTVVAIGTLFVVASPLMAIVYAIMLGIASGVEPVIFGVVWAHYYGRSGLGRVQGAAGTVSIAGAALGPLPIAALQDSTGTFTAGIILMMAITAGCAVIAWLHRPLAYETGKPS